MMMCHGRLRQRRRDEMLLAHALANFISVCVRVCVTRRYATRGSLGNSDYHQSHCNGQKDIVQYSSIVADKFSSRTRPH